MRLRIGTRRSRLAMAQAEEVAALLRGDGHSVELVPMSTAGDRGVATSSAAGVKGLFVGDIDDALVRGDVDLAVHSAKDLPSEDPPGGGRGGDPRTEPPPRRAGHPGAIAPGRRWSARPACAEGPLHPDGGSGRGARAPGNVDTRLRRLDERAWTACTLLAAAGLARLGVEPAHVSALPVDEMVPAPGQGALAVQGAEGSEAAAAAAALDHPPSRAAFEAERHVVSLLGGGCRLPLGAHAEVGDGAVRLTAVVVRPDGSDLLWARVEAGTPHDAASEAAGCFAPAVRSGSWRRSGSDVRGKVVLVTRPAERAEGSLDRLRALGAEAIAAPTITIEDGDRDAMVRAIEEAAAGGFDWVVFTSAAGVRAWWGLAGAEGQVVRGRRSPRWAMPPPRRCGIAG